MAVALDAGLIVPVIRDADRMGLDALSAAAKDLASRAKGNKLTPEESRAITDDLMVRIYRMGETV